MARRAWQDSLGGIGLLFDVTDNGLVALDGIDADADGDVSERSEWTDTPFLTPPADAPQLGFPADRDAYFVNIYAVRAYNDTSIGGGSNGGGTSDPNLGRTGGAFAKTWRSRDPASVASTLLHEVCAPLL